ncbi:MAG: tripartite tricarboxylate transporter substrate binding protein [Hyphomicrobiaceae bacterium]
MKLRSILGSVLAMAVAGDVAAADWPSKPITLIVPYKAGGTTYSMSQVMSKALGRELGTKIVVKPTPGGGSAVGITRVSKAKPDGYTIAYSDLNNMIWNPLAQKAVKYRMKDLRLIAGVASYQPAIISTPKQPYKNFQELIAYSKKKAVNVADMGGISKAILAFIAKKEGVKWNLIPTRGGGEMVPFILGGKVEFAYSGGIHQKYPNEMTVLASFLSKPLAYTPEAPSIQDLYGVSQVGNAVLVGPAGLPDDIAKKIEAAAKKILDDPDFTKLLKNIKFPKAYKAGADLTKLAAETTKSLEKVLAAIQ